MDALSIATGGFLGAGNLKISKAITVQPGTTQIGICSFLLITLSGQTFHQYATFTSSSFILIPDGKLVYVSLYGWAFDSSCGGTRQMRYDKDGTLFINNDLYGGALMYDIV